MSKPVICVMSDSVPKELLEGVSDLTSSYEVLSKESLPLDRLDDVEIALAWNKDLGTKILQSPTSQLKWIQSISAGVDSFDLNRIQEKGIILSTASGVHSTPITESVIGMLLTYLRGIQQSVLQQTEKKWNKNIATSELSGKTLLIVGTGQIGRQLAAVATAFDLKVYGINRSGYSLPNFIKNYPQAEIEEILPKMDIIVNILPLTAETHHFYNKAKFNKMKKGVLFINVGRGPSVKTEDLIEACQNGRIEFAGIDVFEEEPLPKESPLWELENVLITPHISGDSHQYFNRLLPIFKENLSSYLSSGSVIRNVVQLDLGY